MTMRNATLRQLKVFEMVARHLSFSRAADELHLTQPAVSTQVSRLEEHAGLPLFEQIGKKIYLTPAGTEMLHYSRAIIQQFCEVDDAMSKLKGVSGGKLKVGIVSAGDYLFSRLIAEFTRRYKGVELCLFVHNREHLLQQLAANQIDLALMVRPPHATDIVSEPFAPHPYVIVAPPSHPLARKRAIKLSALAGEAFIVRERGSDTWYSMEEGLISKLTDLKIAMEINSTETIKQAVSAGMGIAFLSACTIGLELQVGQLAILDVEGFPLKLNWYVVHPKSKRLPPVALAFKHFLMEEGARLIESTAWESQTTLRK